MRGWLACKQSDEQFEELVVPVCKDARLRKMVVNIMYVGVLAHLLEIEMERLFRFDFCWHGWLERINHSLDQGGTWCVQKFFHDSPAVGGIIYG